MTIQETRTTAEPIVRVESLSIGFPDESGKRLIPIVRDVSFTVQRNEILGLVGESGSGKTQTSLALLGLTRSPGRVTGGRILVDDEDIVGLNEADLRRVRGRKVAMIFQSPRTSLNPLMRVSDQIGRVYMRRHGMVKRTAKAETIAMLRKMGIAGPERVAASYPHQLSGGMAQRVMIGMMVACGAELLIADEPTTGLDVTIQAQIFELITSVQAETQMSVLLITHDLGVVAETCHRVAVMQQGRLVEIGPVNEIFRQPYHPYTSRLLGSVLRPDRPPSADTIKEAGAESRSFTAGGQEYAAVSVDAWRRVITTPPEMVEVGPGHQVLGHTIVRHDVDATVMA